MADVKGPQARYDELMEAATRQGGAENSLGALLGLLGLGKAPAMTAASWLDSQMPRRQIGGQDVLESVVPRGEKLRRKVAQANNPGKLPTPPRGEEFQVTRNQAEATPMLESRRPGYYTYTKKGRPFESSGGEYWNDYVNSQGILPAEGGHVTLTGKYNEGATMKLPGHYTYLGERAYEKLFPKNDSAELWGSPQRKRKVLQEIAKDNRWLGLNRHDIDELLPLPSKLTAEGLALKGARNRGYDSIVGKSYSEWGPGVRHERVILPEYRNEASKYRPSMDNLLEAARAAQGEASQFDALLPRKTKPMVKAAGAGALTNDSAKLNDALMWEWKQGGKAAKAIEDAEVEALLKMADKALKANPKW